MARIVVVASAEIERAALADVISAEDQLYVVVPAVEQSRLQWLANDEGDARAEAQDVGESVAAAAQAPTAQVEVKPDPPRQAVLDAIAEHGPDRIVVALREGDDATWLEEDGLDRLPRDIDGVPVERIHI